MGLEDFVRYTEAGDGDAFVADLAPGFVFHHPSSDHPTSDPNMLRMLIPLARRIFGDEFSFGERLEGDGFKAIRWSARIDGVPADGVDLLREDDEGRLLELRILIRPLAALQAFQAQISAMVGPRPGGGDGPPQA